MTRPGPTPTQLLAAARLTATRPAAWGACWPRATAILTRQALEATIDTLWSGPSAGMADATWRAKLTCLPAYLDPDLARRARHTWHALTAACHAHPYQLAPTLPELHDWIADVEAVLVRSTPAAHPLCPNGQP